MGWINNGIYLFSHMCYVYLKNGPATKPFDKLIRISVDTGLIKYDLPNITKMVLKIIFKKIFSKWMMEHLSMRSVLKPKQDQVNLKPMALTSYYTSIMFYWSAITMVSFVFLLEKFKIVTGDI